MRENGDRENGDKKSFWATLPGILAQIAGLITALTVLYVALHNSVPPSSRSVTVQGTVTDENNMPAGGLKVRIDDLSDITGDDGKYIIQNVPVGVSIILVERMNEVVYRSACEIERSDGIKVIDISIPAEEPTTGEIRLFSDGTSAVGADVYIDGEYQGRMFQSGINALFLITDIPPETYQIKVKKPGYQDFIGSVTVIAGQRTEIDFYLEPSSPLLSSPLNGAVMDNGRTDGKNGIVWDFNWSDVKGATQYQLYIKKDTANTPFIDTVTTSSSYRHIRDGYYITNSNRHGWTWKVRAQVNGQWYEWSETRNFVVEEVDTDPLIPHLVPNQSLIELGNLSIRHT